MVLTAELIEDEWLSQVPEQAAAAQARLATLSTNAIEVLALDTGHFIQDENPSLVLEAIRQVEASARTGKDLPPCGAAFEDVGGECIPPGEIPRWSSREWRRTVRGPRRSTRFDAEVGVPGDDLEIAIAMKDGGILADRHRCDEAVEPVPNPLAGSGAHPLDRGRSFPCLEATDGQESSGSRRRRTSANS